MTHGLNHSLDEQYAQGRQTSEDLRRYGAAREIEGAGLKARGARADIRLKDANAVYAEGRPQLEQDKLTSRQEIEANKLAARQKKDAQNGILAKLRLLKGQRIDPENPRHMKFLQEAEDAGLDIDPDSWNNAAGNWVQIRKLDPENQTHIIVAELNKLTGEERVFKGEDDKPVVTGGTEKRDGEGVTVSARSQMNNSSVALRERLLSGFTGRAKARFDVETRGLFEERRSVEKQISDLHTRASEAKISPAERDRRTAELQGRVDELDTRIEGARSKYAGGSPASAPSSSPTGRVSRKNFGKVREDNPSLRGASDAAVEAALKAMGITVY